MVLNDRRTSSLFAGETVCTGSLSDYTDSEIEQFKQLGLATLKQDNARIAALAEARLQAENASEIRRFQNSALADQNARYGALGSSSPYLDGGRIGPTIERAQSMFGAAQPYSLSGQPEVDWRWKLGSSALGMVSDGFVSSRVSQLPR